MSVPTTTELIRVTGVSPYSVYSGQQRYSFNKGVTSDQFVKGNTYSVNVKVGAKGAKYIDSVSNNLGALEADTISSTPTLNPEINKNSPPDSRPRKTKFGDPLTEYDLEHDARIARSGAVQAAVQAVATHASSVEDLKVKAFSLAEEMITWINKGDK